MDIKPFQVEEWMNAYETQCRYNIAETCVDSISLEALFSLTGEDLQAFWKSFSRLRLTYGDIEGSPSLLEGIASLYTTIKRQHIIPTHGAAGANHHIFYSLVRPGDRVVTLVPTYQQLYSIPESYGAQVITLSLHPEDGFLPDLSTLRSLVTKGTRMLCINNPNNPSGALMPESMLQEIVEIARQADCYLLCDEVYRHLNQEDIYIPSIADLYEKGISVSSMSKVFSLAGIRLGWIATRDPEVRKSCLSHRDYNLISCGMWDEHVGAIALKGKEKVLARSQSLIRENLAVLDTWIKHEPHLSYCKPQAGTTALVFYDYDIPSVDFCRRLVTDYGALVTPGDCFDIPHSFRIGYACQTNELRQGLSALSAMLRDEEHRM